MFGNFIACVSSLLWQDFTTELNINAEELIMHNKEKIMEMLVAKKHDKVYLLCNCLGIYILF